MGLILGIAVGIALIVLCALAAEKNMLWVPAIVMAIWLLSLL